MSLEWVRIRDFRNLREVALEPAPALNVLHGANGHGKTSFLEAVHFLAEGRSFRGVPPNALLRRGASVMSVEGRVRSEVGTHDHLAAAWSAGEKRLRTNDHEAQTLEAYLGSLRVVVHSPEDSQLILGPPELRRRFLNRILVLTKRGFFRQLARYVRALRNRNRCLQERRSSAEIASWTEVLLQLGAGIRAARLELVERLAPETLRAASRLAGEDGAELRLKYLVAGAAPDSPTGESAARKDLEADAERVAARELRVQRTLFGPHLDDLELSMETGPARRHASQGERRTALIALRLAERAVVAEQTGDDPVFLIDDLSSELDQQRSNRVLDAVSGLSGQVFLTGTEPRAGFGRAASFVVRSGEIFEDPSDAVGARAGSARSASMLGRSLS